MPVIYSYRHEDHTLRVQCHGELTITEVMQYFQDIEHDDSIPKGTVELVNLSKVYNINFSYRDAAAMPNAYSPAHAKREIIGTIVFGATPVNMGFAQLIEAYFKRNMPDHFFRTVKTRTEAELLLEQFHSK